MAARVEVKTKSLPLKDRINPLNDSSSPVHGDSSERVIGNPAEPVVNTKRTNEAVIAPKSFRREQKVEIYRSSGSGKGLQDDPGNWDDIPMNSQKNPKNISEK